MRRFASYCLVATALIACGKNEQIPDPVPPAQEKYTLGEPSLVYSFEGDHYSYCPVVVKDGADTHMYFCGNPTAGEFVDNIFHCTLPVETAPVSVLQPSLSWDSRHDCDPSVVEGSFKIDGKTYKYAMFFLSNPLEYFYNEIGVAFSNSLDSATWVKYSKQLITKPWDKEGDLYYSETGRCWGVGQPCAISLNQAGRILLAYTIGELSGTYVAFREIDLSDMSAPVIGKVMKMSVKGLKGLDGKQDWAGGCDFALCPSENVIVMVRPVQPNPTDYPAYIQSALEVDYMDWSLFKQGTGTWTPLFKIDQSLSGFPRNHNAGLARDTFGNIDSWLYPEVYFTVSKAAPDVDAYGSKHAEWTYDIYKTNYIKQ